MRKPCCDRFRFTYVAFGGGLIKIGQTLDLKVRRRGLEGASPVPVRVVAVANGRALEGILHEHFRAYQHHGEWFEMECWPDLHRLFMATVCASCMFVNMYPNTDQAAVLRDENQPRPNITSTRYTPMSKRKKEPLFDFSDTSKYTDEMRAVLLRIPKRQTRRVR